MIINKGTVNLDTNEIIIKEKEKENTYKKETGDKEKDNKENEFIEIDFEKKTCTKIFTDFLKNLFEITGEACP